MRPGKSPSAAAANQFAGNQKNHLAGTNKKIKIHISIATDRLPNDRLKSLACSKEGMEIILRTLVLLMKGKIPENILSDDASIDGGILNRTRNHILHWVVGKPVLNR